MPAKSTSQRRLMGMALAMKRGEVPMSKSKKVAKVARGMSEKELKKYATGARGGRKGGGYVRGKVT